MIKKIEGVFDEALARLSVEKGENVAELVQLVIESRNKISEVEAQVSTFGLTQEQEKYIMENFTEEIASGIAVACNILSLGFNKDIMPLVKRITKSASNRKNLQ